MSAPVNEIICRSEYLVGVSEQINKSKGKCEFLSKRVIEGDSE